MGDESAATTQALSDKSALTTQDSARYREKMGNKSTLTTGISNFNRALSSYFLLWITRSWRFFQRLIELLNALKYYTHYLQHRLQLKWQDPHFGEKFGNPEKVI